MGQLCFCLLQSIIQVPLLFIRIDNRCEKVIDNRQVRHDNRGEYRCKFEPEGGIVCGEHRTE